MSENVSGRPRAEFLARIRRFTDEALDNLNAASRGKDVDEKEALALRSVLLKLLKDLQYKEYEKRLKVIEDSRKLRRTVLSATDAKKLFGPVKRKVPSRKNYPRSRRRRIS